MCLWFDLSASCDSFHLKCAETITPASHLDLLQHQGLRIISTILTSDFARRPLEAGFVLQAWTLEGSFVCLP